ncbi:hypothetical protein Nepgr_015597 [Nepenthes gracilis]|uniref:Growth-regulating factor n=1 Tax=Nepenthes gracilis TaxID=150966 RepID=A0AAD3XRF7_NEPGR|nr:hypothetical protein Nepgr_015597 [Nepenthes gracilis]
MSGRSKFPFTSSQWQELQRQVLIFKYMAAGMPVPSDIFFTVRISHDSSLSSKFFPYQTSLIGWNPYEMDYGRRMEPERCRRTDGKKWRCSKDAYPDSKYCERHMHRGKPRSKKPVEIWAAAVAASTMGSPPSTISSITKDSSTASPSTLQALSSLPPLAYNSIPYDTHHFLYPRSSSSRPSDVILSTHDNSAPLLLESGSFRDRYVHRMKQEVRKHAFFGETSGTMGRVYGSSRDEAWHLNDFKMGGGNCSNQQKQSIFSDSQSGYHCLEHNGETSKQEWQNQQCYVWRRDFTCELPMKEDGENEPQKTIHHFFDESPPIGRDSWHNSSTTQLSISIPSSSDDLFRNPEW